MPTTASVHPTPDGSSPFRALLRLAIPVCLAQVGLKLMNTVDLMVLGHWSHGAKGALTLGSLWAWFVIMSIVSILTAVDPQLAQAWGNRDRAAYDRALMRGLVLAMALAIPGALALQLAAPILELFQQPPELIPDAARYAAIQAIGILPFLWIMLLRSALQTRDRAHLLLRVVIVGNLLNAGLDYVLVNGLLGMPELGVEGAAWTTAVVRWAMCVGLCLGTRDDLRGVRTAWTTAAIRQRALRSEALQSTLLLGLPIALQTIMEMGVFQASTLLAGVLGKPSLEGHAVALDIASTTFTGAVGLSMAAGTVVGRYIGQGDQAMARRAAQVAWLTGLAYSTACMLIMLLLPETLASAFGDADLGIGIAVGLLPIAGTFQLSDGLQVISLGVLRGAGDTRSPLLANFIGFWVLGLPIGYLLAFELELGAAGLWWGFVIGLTIVAVALTWIAWVRLNGPIDRLQPD